MIMKNDKRIVEVFKGNVEIGTIKHSTDTVFKNTSEYLGTLPVTINSVRAENLKSYKFSGNTVQNGTPTPDNPVMPQGTGEMTAQLIDYTQSEQGGIDASGNLVSNITLYRTTVYTPVDTSKTLWVHYTGYLFRLYFYKSDKTFISRIEVPANSDYQVVYPQDTAYIKWTIYNVNGADITTLKSMNIMLNIGSEALPYEPYGYYKIPITSANTTTNIYLGEVPTTRRIKKLVLTGNEKFTKNDGQSTHYLYYADQAIILPNSIGKTPVMCNELPVKSSAPQADIGINTNNQFSVVYFNFGADVMNAQTSGNTVAGLKEYLTAQYAAGTPITIWYVLTTEETGIVNEPLMKIGTYADTVSKEQAGIQIPTNNGTTVIDVDTTVSPSSAYLKWKGYK